MPKKKSAAKKKAGSKKKTKKKVQSGESEASVPQSTTAEHRGQDHRRSRHLRQSRQKRRLEVEPARAVPALLRHQLDQRTGEPDQRAGEQEVLQQHDRLARHLAGRRHVVDQPGGDRRIDQGHAPFAAAVLAFAVLSIAHGTPSNGDPYEYGRRHIRFNKIGIHGLAANSLPLSPCGRGWRGLSDSEHEPGEGSALDEKQHPSPAFARLRLREGTFPCKREGNANTSQLWPPSLPPIVRPYRSPGYRLAGDDRRCAQG